MGITKPKPITPEELQQAIQMGKFTRLPPLTYWEFVDRALDQNRKDRTRNRNPHNQRRKTNERKRPK